ncbi:MAG: hypothetical protein IKW98_11050 [Prevotella sp.]|nr:hypothetical protein [Prevotella sp.]
MNNFIVSPNKVKHIATWFWIIVVAYTLAKIPAPITTPITGYSGLDVLRDLITAPWMKIAFNVVYIAAFSWMLWQISMHLPKSQRWLRWLLWAAIVIYLVRWLYGWIVPIPDFTFDHLGQFKYYQAGRALIFFIYLICMLAVGALLSANHGGRLCHLGWAIIAWMLVPEILPMLYALVWTISNQNFDPYPSLIIVELILAIYVFWRMRLVFIPNWQSNDKKEEQSNKE